MVYAAPFHRLVMIGSLYTDIFNVTLSMVPAGGGTLGPVSQGLCDDVAAIIANWWNDTPAATPPGGIDMIGPASLNRVKLNRIGVDGRYEDAETIETNLTPVPGGGGANFFPAQESLAATLRGPDPRARAGKGRMFFPPSLLVKSNLASDGRIPSATATVYASGVVTLLQNINDAYFSASVSAVAGIASQAGAGAFQPVSEVTVGRVPDTIRSRRNKLSEDFVTVAI